MPNNKLGLSHTRPHTHNILLPCLFCSILNCAALCLMPIQFIKCVCLPLSLPLTLSFTVAWVTHRYTATDWDLDTHRSILANKFCTLEIFVIDVPWPTPTPPLPLFDFDVSNNFMVHVCAYVCICICVCAPHMCVSWAGESFNCFLQLELLVSAPGYNCVAVSVDCTAAAAAAAVKTAAPTSSSLASFLLI